MSTQKNPKTLLNLMNIHKTRTFQIFEFQNSKSFNFRVLKLEICQFSSFKTRKLNDFRVLKLEN